MSNKNILQRYGHSSAPLAISPECVEVVLFGGRQELGGSSIADTTALRFGLTEPDGKPDYVYDYTVNTSKLIWNTVTT